MNRGRSNSSLRAQAQQLAVVFGEECFPLGFVHWCCLSYIGLAARAGLRDRWDGYWRGGQRRRHRAIPSPRPFGPCAWDSLPRHRRSNLDLQPDACAVACRGASDVVHRVFVFDLVALGLLVSTESPVATQEIEVLCDTTHVNAAADIHSTFDNVTGGHAPAEVLERVRFPVEYAQRHRRRPIHQSHQTHRRQAAHLPGRVSAKADGQHDCLVRWPHRRLKSAWWSKPL